MFKKPGDDVNDGNVLVKRAVAGPGDTVKVKDKVLYVNGQPADGPYVQHIDPEIYRPGDPAASEMALLRDQFGPFRVPDGAYFGMGDNRDVSLDSRYWGFIPQANVIGRPMFIYWSFETPAGQYLEREVGQRVGFLAHVVIHFFDETRWRRTFKAVQ